MFSTPQRVTVLVVGDLVVFLAFAVLGLHSHNEPVDLGGLSRTFLPFALSWLVLAPWFGAYRSPIVDRPGVAWWRVLLLWLLCGVAALLLRSWALQRPLVPAFIAITLLGNGALLVAWRTLFAWWSGRRAEAVAVEGNEEAFRS